MNVPDRARIRAEVWIVLALSLLQSAVYAVVSLVAKLTEPGGLAEASATLNASASERPWLDLTSQLLSLGFNLVPVLLALFLLGTFPGPLRRGPLRDGASVIGLSPRPWRQSLGIGAVLALGIGIPGLGLYGLGRMLGITVNVVPSALGDHWWTIPILLLSALRAGLLEEIIVVAYLRDRLSRLGWGPWAFVLASAVLCASYHLYQGIGPFVGNLVMGLVFALVYLRARRVAPLVVAHTLMDATVFVGYPVAFPWLSANLPGVFGEFPG